MDGLFLLFLSTLLGFLNGGVSYTAPMTQTAIVVNSIPQAPSTTFLFVLPAVMPGLLPSTTVPFCPASSTCNQKISKSVVVFTPVVRTVLVPKKTSNVPPLAIFSLTAQDVLNDASMTMREERNGPYEISFISNKGSQTIAWNISDTHIGGAPNNPQFNGSFSCDPVPTPADPGALDQSPQFKPETTYDCSISLTPLSGSDMRTQSRDFRFTTPPGQLFVLSAPGANAVLVNNTNEGSVVFENNDPTPITITSMSVSVSYTDMNSLGQPLVLRVLDPVTEQSVFDYHLENSSTNPSASVTTKMGITIPLSFVVEGSSQKMLPIEIVGVQKMTIPGTTPSAIIAVTGVTTNRSEVKTNLGHVTVAWSCSVPTAGYDPNATSGPFFSGDACKN